MKNENVKKVNTIGKVSRILITIVQVFLIIGFVCTILAGIVLAFLPNDFISVKGQGTAEIILNTDDIPKGIIDLDDIQESNLDFHGFGYTLKWIVKEKTVENGQTHYDIDAAVDGISGMEIKLAAVLSCFGTALIIALFYVVSVFGKRLAKSLEACESPFEDKVVKAMKAFGISLIPWAVVKLLSGAFSGLIIVLLVMIVLLFVNIFRYGAELQKESDETL